MSLSSIADVLRDVAINNRAIKRFKTLWSPTAVLLDGQGNEVIGDKRSEPGAHTVLQRLKDLKTQIVLANGSNIIGKVNITQGGNDVDVLAEEGIKSSRIVMGVGDDFHIFLRANNISASTGYILVGLNDTVNFPHSNTDHILVTWMEISINPSASPLFVGDVCIGFLSDIDETDATINILKEYHLERGSQPINIFSNYNSSHYSSSSSQSLLDFLANQTAFNTGAQNARPGNGNVTPANGDLIMLIGGITAGSVDVGISLGYRTAP